MVEVLFEIKKKKFISFPILQCRVVAKKWLHKFWNNHCGMNCNILYIIIRIIMIILNYRVKPKTKERSSIGPGKHTHYTANEVIIVNEKLTK